MGGPLSADVHALAGMDPPNDQPQRLALIADGVLGDVESPRAVAPPPPAGQGIRVIGEVLIDIYIGGIRSAKPALRRSRCTREFIHCWVDRFLRTEYYGRFAPLGARARPSTDC